VDPVSILSDLVAIPSVNPMGRAVTGPIYLETRLTEHLVGFFQKLGVEHVRQDVAPDRANVVARVRGRGTGPRILLDAHQDTVPVDGMTIDPFKPIVDGDRLYGRGACDVKGGMAAMLSAFARLAGEKQQPPGDVIMSCTCDEESTTLGVQHFVKQWQPSPPAGEWWRQKPDLAIAAEPTDLDVVVAHRGASRWKIHTHGRACHSSEPSNGVNAIYKMAPVIAALEEYAALVGDRVKPHPRCGRATLSIGRIDGGVSVNTVPDACSIEIDRRILPGEDGWEAIHDVERFLKERTKVEFTFGEPWLVGMALSDATNGPLSDRLLECITAIAGSHKKVGVPYGTHASRFDAVGVPSAVFGPGSILQAHTKDEWISITELRQAAEVYYRFCAEPA
jgi:succinyl-diaminopimelate desuccinylase